ncbi:MAG: hypothetical protein AAB669_01545 [Patescibacteria group bacterium]
MKPIYLEPDEEITSIIDRLAKVDEKKIAVVVPKNSTMFQSLVNLKLLARQAQKLGKEVAIISSNKIGSRLAKQVGLETYASLGTVSNAPTPTSVTKPTPSTEPVGADVLPDGTPVHRYSPEVGTQQLATSQEPLADDDEEPELVSQPDANFIEPEASGQLPVAPDNKPEAVPDEPETPIDLPVASSQKLVAPPSLPPIVSRGVQTRHEFVFPWKSAAVAGSLVIIAFIVTFLFLPKATVTLTFPAILLSDTVTLTAKTTATEGEGIIAGNLLTTEKTLTQEVTATGQKDVGTKASGSVAVKNCEDTNPHSLAAGTKATASSKTFTTGAAVTIPAGTFSGGGTVCTSSTVSVTLTASEAGTAHNLASATFTFAGLASRISATGSTTGGTTKQITVLSQDDVDQAYSALKTQLVTDATNDLKSKAGTQSIVAEAIKQTVVEQKVDKSVGAEVAKATASVTINLFTITFDQSTIDAAVKTKLSEKLTADQELIIAENQIALPAFKEMSDDKTSLTLTVAASGFAAPIINKKAVTKEVKNKSVTSAESFLKDKYQASNAKIEIIPGWWLKRLPILSQAITVEYGYEETTPQPKDAIPGT